MNHTLTKIESLLQNKKKVFLILFFLILCQLFYSFLFPAYNISNDYWKTIEELSFHKDYSFDSLDNLIAGKIYPFLSDYHINSDCGGYMLLAHDFPQHYFRGHLANLNRPLYPFLVYLISRPIHLIGGSSYALTFLAGIFLNFILFFLTVFFFYSLVKKIISWRVAFLSSVLLIFSPFAHIWLIQPETNIFGAFMVIFNLYLLYNYITHPSIKKLIIFSLIIGILILGKMIFAIPIFILILAIYFKRYKEGVLFLIIHLIPRALWYLWVTKVFKIGYFSTEVIDFDMGVWMFKIFYWPWFKTAEVFLEALPKFTNVIIYGFLLVPVLFALIGFRDLSFKRKRLFCFGLIFSFFTLFFIMNYYSPRHAFLLFPVIYPLTILGIDRVARFLKKYKSWYSPVFYLVVFVFLIIISSVNVFKIFSYEGGFFW